MPCMALASWSKLWQCISRQQDRRREEQEEETNSPHRLRLKQHFQEHNISTDFTFTTYWLHFTHNYINAEKNRCYSKIPRSQLKIPTMITVEGKKKGYWETRSSVCWRHQLLSQCQIQQWCHLLTILIPSPCHIWPL